MDRHGWSSFIFLIVGVFVLVVQTEAKTLFVVDRGASEVDIFNVDSSLTISPIKTISFAGSDFYYGLGPIDLAMDPMHRIVFVSVETIGIDDRKLTTSKIALINYNTLTHIKDIEFPQVNDFGGLWYDAPRQRLYAIDRNSNLLYVLKWHPETLDIEYERVIALPHIQYACALIVEGDDAYITEYRYHEPMQYYNHILHYDISQDWAYVRTIDNGQASTCLAYDSQRWIFYSGAYDYQGTYHYVIKHSLLNGILVRDTGGCMIDGQVDMPSGYLYLTTYRTDPLMPNNHFGAVEIWDTSGWTGDPNQAISPLATYDDPNVLSGPAGLLLFDANPLPDVIGLTKEDGLNPDDPNDWVVPGDIYAYTIAVDPNSDYAWMQITDYLPEGVHFVSATPNTGTYTDWNHSYTWTTGAVGGSDPNLYFTLTVQVNSKAEPKGTLLNEVIAESDIGFGRAYELTQVDCFGGNVIYVNSRAEAEGNGTSWTMAYKSLRKATDRATRDCGTQIWVARGTYSPGPNVTDHFAVPDNVSLYGGFAGTETAIDQRDIQANPTILSGYIRTVNGVEERNEKAVTMGNNSLLDGVTVEKGKRGVEGVNVYYDLHNCNVKDNWEYGVFCQNGSVIIKNCFIGHNKYDGIYHYGGNYTLTVENCLIGNNKQNGIICQYSTPTIINSVIHHNGSDSSAYSTYYGIRLFQPSSRPVLRNNTIVCNTHAGIYYVNNSYGTLPKPQVKNCIVWHNAEAEGFADIQGLNDIVHSCLTDPNDVYAINTQADARGNLRSNPVFAYSNLSLDNFHLAYHSPCKDMGDPNETATTEVDMDKQARIAGNSVEMGADEVDCEDVFNSLDWDADGLVNLKEFKAFSAAWLTIDPNHPNLPNPVEPNAILHWNPMCDLDDDLDIDLADLMVLVPEWCWSACWRHDMSVMQQTALLNAMSLPEITENRSLSVDSIESVDRKTLSPQKSIRQEALELQEAIQFLEQLWLDESALRETNTTENWNSFMQSLQEGLVELKTKTNILILSEEVQ